MAMRARRRPVVSGQEQMIGMQGVVMGADATGTWAQVQGERWKVSSPDELAAGQHVRVVGFHGLTLDVRREPETVRTNPP